MSIVTTKLSSKCGGFRQKFMLHRRQKVVNFHEFKNRLCYQRLHYFTAGTSQNNWSIIFSTCTWTNTFVDWTNNWLLPHFRDAPTFIAKVKYEWQWQTHTAFQSFQQVTWRVKLTINFTPGKMKTIWTTAVCITGFTDCQLQALRYQHHQQTRL